MTDLVTLAQELRAIDLKIGLDLNLALRAAKRTRKSQAGREGYVRGRIEELARRSGRALVSDRAAGVPALTGFDPSRDDWDQCPACGFILVACDCDAPTINLERTHAA